MSKSTLYAACLRRLGLSQEEAGVVHARYGKPVSESSINSWSAGRREPPLGVFDELRQFAEAQRAAVGYEPLSIAQALHLEHQVSYDLAYDRGMPGVNAMMAAIADRLLA